MEVHYPFEVIYYVSSDGWEPFTEWKMSIKDNIALNLIDARLARVRLGNFGNARYVGKGVHELKINYGPGFRIYFARSTPSKVIFLLGGDKGSQKKDIKKSILFLQDYVRRRKNETL